MKKKMIVFIMCSLLIGSLAGCGKKNNGNSGNTAEATVATSEELLTNVWETYEDSERFSAGGGDYENIVENAPGKVDVTKEEDLDSMLGLPADSGVTVEDAASLVHMMNANLFTAGAFHVENREEAETLADSLRSNIVGRQWICGFPDTLIVATVENEYVVSAFGDKEIIATFKTKLFAEYPSAELIYEEELE